MAFKNRQNSEDVFVVPIEETRAQKKRRQIVSVILLIFFLIIIVWAILAIAGQSNNKEVTKSEDSPAITTTESKDSGLTFDKGTTDNKTNAEQAKDTAKEKSKTADTTESKEVASSSQKSVLAKDDDGQAKVTNSPKVSTAMPSTGASGLVWVFALSSLFAGLGHYTYKTRSKNNR